ncbi:MAG: peptide chain release factor N(5)-glutamine methyltransferase [Oscillospiraceae bacterium]|nr:peptide chain release factor N(5)-glutamine methyltransferase [Oscillospiraceae bacterium]
MVTIGELYTNLKSVLRLMNIDTYAFEAKLIIEKAFDSELPRILMNRDSAVPESILDNIQDMTEKRKKGFPIQYILGEWEFYGYRFKVGEGVLIPRQDTETLIDYVLDICRKNNIKSPKIIDLCSGTGCIAIALKKEMPDSEIYALENSGIALEYLEYNAKLNQADIKIMEADVLEDKYTDNFKDFDIIVSNPPYLTRQDMRELQPEVRFEPITALYAGEDGLYFYQRITPLWKKILKSGGMIVYEIGMNQHESVSDILKSNNFNQTEFIKDTAGIIRVVSGVKQED